MNRIFKVLWSKVRGCFVVAGELANGYGKNKRRATLASTLAAVLTAAALVPIMPTTAQAANLACHYAGNINGKHYYVNMGVGGTVYGIYVSDTELPRGEVFNGDYDLYYYDGS